MQKRSLQKLNNFHPVYIERSDQYAAISSTVRDQILQIVVYQTGSTVSDGEDRDGVSIREIARQIGRKPGSLYRHIDILVNADLIRPAGSQPTGGRDAQGYIADGNIVYVCMPEDQESLDLLCRNIERSARAAGRESSAANRAFAKKQEETDTPLDYDSKDYSSIGLIGWLDPDQQSSVRQKMLEIAEIFRNAARRPNTKFIATDVFIRPVVLPDGTTPIESADSED